MTGSVLSSRAIIGEFYRVLAQGAAGWANALSFPVNSNQETENYAWLGMTPAMREMIGGRHAKGLRDFAYAVKNKPWEATLEVSVDDLRRDKTGQLMVRVAEMADRANAHWARLLSTLILAGPSTACYDGQYFFDTDHAEGDSGTQSNDLSIDISALPTAVHGATTAPSPAEMLACIMKATEAILGFVDDQGEPMNETAKQFVVMVPTPLWSPAVSAITAKTIDGGDTNVIVNLDGYSFTVAANPRLTWTENFAVFRADGRVRPFIRQEEVPVEASAVAEGSELEFNERKHRYGLFASGNAGFGMWSHACLVTMT